ncbi:uncharacterized protein [Watersipora subatra]|uniref:uncharacterized protein n=1 Tax=Watersipora subatra TaxID=2589382 RepID=UPI00355C900F
MSHVHYKFQSSNDHDTITFDGLSISLADLRTAILNKSKLAPSADLSIQITNAQTKEVYKNDSDLVPKNTSVNVTRVPIAKVFKGDDDGENVRKHKVFRGL